MQRYSGNGVLPDTLARLGYTLQTADEQPLLVPPVSLVPAGPFVMGSDPQHDPDAWPLELPQHWVVLATYEIAIYPVTVAEYACAVRAGVVPAPPGGMGEAWGTWEAQLQTPDHPAVMMAWRDALAYARWLSKRTGDRWRLPTEAEWEKAARGTDARIYPWGDAFDARRANTDEAGLRHLTPVHAYPQGASPYGVIDLIGNALERCSSAWRSYPYDPSDGREDMVAEGTDRIARGGCYFDYANNARAATRWPLEPTRQTGPFGMRVVRDPR